MTVLSGNDRQLCIEFPRSDGTLLTISGMSHQLVQYAWLVSGVCWLVTWPMNRPVKQTEALTVTFLQLFNSHLQTTSTAL